MSNQPQTEKKEQTTSKKFKDVSFAKKEMIVLLIISGIAFFVFDLSWRWILVGIVSYMGLGFLILIAFLIYRKYLLYRHRYWFAKTYEAKNK